MKWGDLGGFCGFLNSGPPGGGLLGPFCPPPFQAGPPKSKKSSQFRG